MKSLILIFLTFLSFNLFAQSVEEFQKLDDDKKINFLETIADMEDTAAKLIQFESENKFLMEKFNKVGMDVSYVWGDTILEGPYAQTGEAEIELVGVFSYNDLTYALIGVVSAPGVFIESEDCDYDDENDEWNRNCESVTIYEYFYMDLQGNYIESDRYPEVDF